MPGETLRFPALSRATVAKRVDREHEADEEDRTEGREGDDDVVVGKRQHGYRCRAGIELVCALPRLRRGPGRGGKARRCRLQASRARSERAMQATVA
jgi:hypothetical protein